MLNLILGALWYIWPAYIANAFPPVIRGKIPVDLNKKFRNKPILGKNKTIEGSIGGILFGVAVGIFQVEAVQPLLIPYIDLPILTVHIVVLLSIGAILGDFIGSFLKRQINKKSGEPLLIVDQLDFLFGALLLTWFQLDITYIIILIIITVLFHVLASLLAYSLKIKKDKL